MERDSPVNTRLLPRHVDDKELLCRVSSRVLTGLSLSVPLFSVDKSFENMSGLSYLYQHCLHQPLMCSKLLVRK